jgi:hypothetical protein
VVWLNSLPVPHHPLPLGGNLGGKALREEALANDFSTAAGQGRTPRNDSQKAVDSFFSLSKSAREPACLGGGRRRAGAGGGRVVTTAVVAMATSPEG